MSDASDTQKCTICGGKIKMQAFKNTGVCCGKCKELRDGKDERTMAQMIADTPRMEAPPRIGKGGVPHVQG